MAAYHRIIFAIGGGELAELETLPIDRQIVAAARANCRVKKGRVRVLFIPTASGDDPEYYRSFQMVYGDKLGCRTDCLYLYGGATSKAAIAKKIKSAHLVYVGGGSTPAMMKMWRRYGVDKLLVRDYRRGVVLSGLSAGANCWFKYALSNAYEGRWTTVRGLNLIGLCSNVHYDSEPGRKRAFDRLVKEQKIAGIAIEDNACIKIIDNTRYEIIKSKRSAAVYRIEYKNGKIDRERLGKAGGYIEGISSGS